ncbi:MAG: ScpA family protein [Pseudomonadota bacterium]|nr:ScpA family protein [Pseudomonadota bacterium]
MDNDYNKQLDLFHVNLDGYEGPLDLLLTLAKEQKVDLLEISILDLASQYLNFIDQMKRIDIDLAADYIVMASWLAFLKSKLLLPIEDDEDVSAQELSAILAFRLRRLEAMREVGSSLLTRDREGIHVFRRGMPEPIFLIKNFNHKDTLFDLISSYSGLRNRNYDNKWKPRVFSIFSIEDARNRLEKMLGTAIDWTKIEDFLPINNDTTEEGILFRRSSLASIFSASLELSKEGLIEISQNKNFGSIKFKVKETESNVNEMLA